MASPASPIDSLNKGINSYVDRPKQWSVETKTMSHDGGCRGQSESQVRQSITDQCNNVCTSDPQNKTDCKLDYHIDRHDGCTTCVRHRPGLNDTTYRCGTKYVAHGTCSYKQRQTGAKWHLTQFILDNERDQPRNNTISSEHGTKENPCQYYTGNSNQSAKCQTIRQGSYDFDDPNTYPLHSKIRDQYGNEHKVTTDLYMRTNVTPKSGGRLDGVRPHLGGLDNAEYTPPELPVGTKICFGLSIDPWINCGSDPNNPGCKDSKGHGVDGNWRHSAPKCYVVSKKPCFSVENSLVATDGRISTGINRRLAGSWTEYSATALGTISPWFGTNAATAQGTVLDRERWHHLSFANYEPQTHQGYGRFRSTTVTRPAVSPGRVFTQLAKSEGNTRPFNYAHTKAQYHGSNQTIAGKLSGIHVYDGKTTITDNVIASADNNTGVLAGLKQAVIVVNGDLVINSNVTRVEAWLIVQGTLYTSDRPVTESTLSKDNGIDTNNADDKQLFVKGPIHARRIKLRRTHGAGIKRQAGRTTDQLTQPAERFTDNPDTYVWAYHNSIDNGRIQTVYMREVAPRY